MPPTWEKRLVTSKGESRKGILLWWQHEHGVKARIAACAPNNRCGITRNITEYTHGAPLKCARCDKYAG